MNDNSFFKNKIKKIGDYNFSFIIKTLTFMMTLFNTIIINRYLGPTLKGELAYYLNVINIMIIILNFGIYQAYPNFKKNKIENVKNLFLNGIVILLFINIIIISPFILFTNNLRLSYIYFLIPIMVFSRQLGFISLVENLKIKNIVTLFTLFLYSVGLLIIYFIFNPSISTMFALLYFQEIMFIILTIKTLNFRFRIKSFSFSFMIKIVRFGILPMFTVLLSMLNYKVDIFIIKDLLDYDSIGIYSVGINFADIIGIIPNVIQEVLFARSTKKSLKAETIKALKITLYINIITALVFIILGNNIIIMLYGKNFSYSAIIAIIAIFSMIPMTFFKLSSSILIIEGKQIVTFIVLFISVVCNISLNYLLIPKIGILGAAISSLISYTFSGLSILIYFCKENTISIFDIVFITKNDFLELKNYLIKTKYGQKLIN